MSGRHESTGRSRLRAPALHRAIAALACPVVGYFVARLLLRYVHTLPVTPTYAVCLGVALVLAVRAWRARIDLGTKTLKVHNTLITRRLERQDVKRVSDTGRIEWLAGQRRPMRLPSEALHGPWWTFGTGRASYASNRARLASWQRTSPRVDVEAPPAEPAA
ncbi:hypothetical protein ACWEOW_08050 [Monashia sp. NPDC004114]